MQYLSPDRNFPLKSAAIAFPGRKKPPFSDGSSDPHQVRRLYRAYGYGDGRTGLNPMYACCWWSRGCLPDVPGSWKAPWPYLPPHGKTRSSVPSGWRRSRDSVQLGRQIPDGNNLYPEHLPFARRSTVHWKAPGTIVKNVGAAGYGEVFWYASSENLTN